MIKNIEVPTNIPPIKFYVLYQSQLQTLMLGCVQCVNRLIASQSLENSSIEGPWSPGAHYTRDQRFFGHLNFKVAMRIIHRDALYVGTYGMFIFNCTVLYIYCTSTLYQKSTEMIYMYQRTSFRLSHLFSTYDLWETENLQYKNLDGLYSWWQKTMMTITRYV